MTKRDRLCLSVHLLCKFNEICDWIRARREHEDQWSEVAGIFIAFRKVESGRDDKLFAKLYTDPRLNSRKYLIHSNRFQD